MIATIRFVTRQSHQPFLPLDTANREGGRQRRVEGVDIISNNVESELDGSTLLLSNSEFTTSHHVQVLVKKSTFCTFSGEGRLSMNIIVEPCVALDPTCYGCRIGWGKEMK